MPVIILGVPAGLILVLWAGQLRPLPGPLNWPTFCVLLLVLMALCRVLAKRGHPVVHYLVLLVALACGGQLALLGADRFVPLPLTVGAPYAIRGQVVGLPQTNRFGHRVWLTLGCVSKQLTGCHATRNASLLWPRLIEVNIPRKLWQDTPLPGQQFRFQAYAQDMKKDSNPGSFDLLRWYKANHVIARFRIKQTAHIQVTGNTPTLVGQARVRLREAIGRWMAERPGQADLEGPPVLLALVTGDRSLMTQAHWQVFNGTGTTHLVAISGAHIMLVAGVVIAFLNRLLRHWAWLTQRLPAMHAAMGGGWLVAVLYGAIAGFGLPVQRALIMLTVLVLYTWWGRSRRLWLAWMLAFFLVLVWDPMAVYAIGFWLSFLAVYWIIWVSGGSVIAAGKVRTWIRIQSGIFIGLAPVLLWQLQNVSLVSCLTNLFAIPLVGLVLTPLALIWALLNGISVTAASVLLSGAGWLAQQMVALLDWFAHWPFAVLYVAPHTMLEMMVGMLGVAWLATAGLPARWLAPLLLMPMLLPSDHSNAVWVRDSGTAAQLAIDTEDHVFFVGEAGWPNLLAPWQKTFLRFWGVDIGFDRVKVSDAALFWQAEGWSLNMLKLQRDVLGQRRVVGQQFFDLCSASSASPGSLVWQVLYRSRSGKQCAVALNVDQQHWLLLSGMSLKIQAQLLARFPLEMASDRVLMHPHAGDRLLPGLLQLWQQHQTELLLTRAPPQLWNKQLQEQAVRYRLISVTGALQFPLHPQ